MCYYCCYYNIITSAYIHYMILNTDPYAYIHVQIDECIIATPAINVEYRRVREALRLSLYPSSSSVSPTTTSTTTSTSDNNSIQTSTTPSPLPLNNNSSSKKKKAALGATLLFRDTDNGVLTDPRYTYVYITVLNCIVCDIHTCYYNTCS